MFWMEEKKCKNVFRYPINSIVGPDSNLLQPYTSREESNYQSALHRVEEFIPHPDLVRIFQ